MVQVKPFRGLRPPANIAAKLSAPPYDVISSEEARLLAHTAGETSFLRVNRPEVDLPADANQYDVQVYEVGSRNLRKFIENGWLKQDQTPSFYIYSQRMGEHLQTGVVAGVAVEEYAMGVIKRHEKTQVKKENDRTTLTHMQNANVGPVFLTYRPDEGIDELVAEITTRCKPDVQFVAPDGVEHCVWPVKDPIAVFAVRRAFDSVEAAYIADGHHRSASAFRVGEMKIKEAVARGDTVTGEEPFNHFLAVLFPANQLLCMEYNRIVRDLAGLSEREFLERVAVSFDVREVLDGERAEPATVHEMGMCLKGRWYRLQAKNGTFPDGDPVKSLDVQILYDNILNPVLNIGNPRADERICYVGGVRGSEEVRRRVTDGVDPWAVGFCMYPVSLDQVMRVADQDMLMPPKMPWNLLVLGDHLKVNGKGRPNLKTI